ncbi:MAG: hypothetical protein U1A27_00490 [Phycisphaerae bacterium]
MRARIAFGILVLVGCVGAVQAQTIDPFYAGSYSYADLGPVSDVPLNYGGLTLKLGDPNTLLIGGLANGSAGGLYSVNLIRDIDGHITGFSGLSTRVADAAYNDGGVVYGPGNVLFLARWPVNELGQTLPGSGITDKITSLAPYGVEGSLSALNFVPAGYPGAGRMKLVTWAGGQWLDTSVTPDGLGTYDLGTVTDIPASRLGGGPEGFTYVPLGSPLFPVPTMIVSEYSAGNVATYELDANGDPIVATRRAFLTGLSGAEGAFIDPLTGDFLFTTYGGGNHMVAVRGFVPEPASATLLLLSGLAALRRRAAR